MDQRGYVRNPEAPPVVREPTEEEVEILFVLADAGERATQMTIGALCDRLGLPPGNESRVRVGAVLDDLAARGLIEDPTRIIR